VVHRKRATELLSTSLLNIDKLSKCSHWYVQCTYSFYVQFAMKLTLKMSPHSKRVATLPCEILIFINCTSWTTATETKRTWTKGNVIMVDELVLSQQNQLQIYRSIYQTAQGGVIRIIFLMLWRSWFEVFKETPTEELTNFTSLSRTSRRNRRNGMWTLGSVCLVGCWYTQSVFAFGRSIEDNSF